ncbi:MAG: ROK family protein, partial [Desulfurococcaceae archaeon]
MSYVLAIDIGGTKIASALVDPVNGTMISYDINVTDRRGGEYVIKQLANIIEEKRTLFKNNNIIGIGISIPGIVKDFNKIVWAPNIPLWSNIKLCDELKKNTSFQDNILLLDDRVATALGEIWQGEARGFRDVITLIIGTGVGAGIVLNGKPVIGSTGATGAIGWWLLSKTLPRRNTVKGFLEESISGPAIVKKTKKLCREKIFKNDCEKLKKLCNDIIDTKCIFRAYDEGIGIAMSILKKVV